VIFSIIGYILGAAITTVAVGLLGDPIDLGEVGSWSGIGLVSLYSDNHHLTVL